jgi:hypothetical protein
MGSMKRFMPVAAIVALLGSPLASSQVIQPSDAADLVRAMRADAIMLEASRSALSGAVREGHYTAAEWQCFQQLPASAFTFDLALLLSRELSGTEIREALAFYRSPAGVKFVDFIFGSAAAESSPVAEPAMSPDDLEAASRFVSTHVGKKLARDMFLIQSDESQQIARNIVGDRLTVCALAARSRDADPPSRDQHG